MEMISIDFQSRTPIYEQIINQVERLISLGVYKPKEQMPSIRELAMTLGINPNTVKKAYEELENRGDIITISTKGTFISENIQETINRNISEKMKLINNLVDELIKLGMDKKDIIEGIEMF